MRSHYRREASVGAAAVLLGAVLTAVSPGFFSQENLLDLLLANVPVLIIALGMTLVILVGEIDISVGSSFALCGIVAGGAAKLGCPVIVAAAVAMGAGLTIGVLNGALLAYARIPSIVVTLATMAALRDGLRWATEGTWMQDLPPSFQWMGLTQSSYPYASGAAGGVLLAALAWMLGHAAAGRSIYAVGSNAEAARLAGFNVPSVKLAAFAGLGALTGAAAFLNAVRFNQIPSNAGIGLEMRVIASVVVGGAAISGGRGTVLGTALGVALLGAIGPALTFVGVSAYWERAIQGVIILAAVAIDAIGARRSRLSAAPVGTRLAPGASTS